MAKPRANPDFLLRRWTVTVSKSCGCVLGESEVLAASRGKALADVWRSDIFNGVTFSQFLRMAKARLSWSQPVPQDITVSGERAYGLGHNGQYVQFCRPGSEVVFSSHPLDVLPVSARPAAYRSVE